MTFCMLYKSFSEFSRHYLCGLGFILRRCYCSIKHMESSLGICGDWFQETSHQYRHQKPGCSSPSYKMEQCMHTTCAYPLVYYKASISRALMILIQYKCYISNCIVWGNNDKKSLQIQYVSNQQPS